MSPSTRPANKIELKCEYFQRLEKEQDEQEEEKQS